MELDNYDERLDDSWIKEFATSDKLYQDFYKDDNYYTDVHYVYVNTDNNIVKIDQETFLFNAKNMISRDDIIGLIKRNSEVDSVRYSIMSILKYNNTLEPESIKQFVYDDPDNTTYNYMTPIKNIDSIKFDPTINMFQDLNDLLFIFYEKPAKTCHNSTKKIFIHHKPKNKKTTRKQYD
jgi:hypothetical protein